MDQYESSVKCIPFPQERVYAKLEDLNNLEAIKDKLPTDKVQDFKYSRDEDREAPKFIKLEAVGSPFPTNMWIQIIPDGEAASKLRVVVKTELNFMIRSMIEKPLKDGIEKVAEVLAVIQY